MAISPYLKELREKVGTQLLLVPSVGAIIRDGEGNILLQKVSFDERWSIPGGAIDPGETPEEAVVREVREETGLHVHPSHILAVLGGENFRYTYPNGDQVEYHFPLFVCNILSGELGGLDDETEELRFFPVDALPEFVLPYPIDILTSQ